MSKKAVTKADLEEQIENIRRDYSKLVDEFTALKVLVHRASKEDSEIIKAHIAMTDNSVSMVNDTVDTLVSAMGCVWLVLILLGISYVLS